MVYSMKMKLLCLFSTFFCIFALAACGQKGPLFLPGDPSKMQSLEGAQEEALNEDEEEDKRDENSEKEDNQ
jgi:predicted small lipoprotein YifL